LVPRLIFPAIWDVNVIGLSMLCSRGISIPNLLPTGLDFSQQDSLYSLLLSSNFAWILATEIAREPVVNWLWLRKRFFVRTQLKPPSMLTVA